MATVPNRSASAKQVDDFNRAMRSQPWYQQWFAMQRLDPNRVRLSEQQRAQLAQVAQQHGFPIPKGMKIDEAGNLNQKNTLGRNLAIGAAIGGGALTGLGFAGLGPLSALGGSASASIPGTLAAGGNLAATESAAAYPFLAGSGSALGGAATGAASGAGASLAKNATSGLAEKGVSAALTALAGLPAIVGNHGPTAQETALTDQIQALLQQQQQRSQYQQPLYEAVTQMAYGLLPKRPGGYPGGS